MKSIKLVSLVGLCIGLLNANGIAEEPVIITQPFAVDLDNVNTNHYGGAYTILGLRVMGGTNTLATGYAASAGGESAFATHDNVFVWSDGTLFGSTLPCQFSAFASNGFQLMGGPVYGNGTGLTNLNLSQAMAGSLTSDKLADGAVTALKLQPGSVGTTVLAVNAVTAEKLASQSVSTNKMVVTEWNQWGDGRYISKSGLPDIEMNPGRMVAGYGLNLTNISPTAYGASQNGVLTGSKSVMTIMVNAYGASQAGNNSATQTIGQTAYGASQRGSNTGTQTIGTSAYGALQQGYNRGVQTIGSSAYGALQHGYNISTQIVSTAAYGASQRGYNTGSQTIGLGGQGSSQSGLNSGVQTIANVARGASQSGWNAGTQAIGASAHGAEQRGYVAFNARATNNGIGSIQLLNLTNNQTAYITGKASIGLGACTVTNDQAIVAGDGLVSHGNGSVTARGFHGDGSGLTNLNLATAMPRSITADKLAVGAVTASSLLAGSVIDAALATNAVNSIKILDGTIVNQDIAADAAISPSKVTGLPELANSVTAHVASATNPHKVDAKQVGALPLQGGIIRGDTEVQLQVFDNNGNGRIGLSDSETGLYGQGIGSESKLYPFQNPALGYLYRWVNTGGGPWKIYDAGNFIAGKDYLPAGAMTVHNTDALAHEQLFATKTDYSTATNIAQSVLLASGVQTNHTGDITVNGMLSANGFTGDGSGLTNLNLSSATPGTITADMMAAGAVTATALAANSVGATAIASGAVTSAKLAGNSVTTSAIASNAVTSAKLAMGSVTTAALASNAVTAVNLAANSVGTNKAVMAEWNAWGNARYMAAAGTPDLVLGEPGRIVGGQGVSLLNISMYAYGAFQLGLNWGTQTIGVWGEGASQIGENWGNQTIDESAFGAMQRGYNDNVQTVGTWAIGASQVGANCGFQTIGMESFGASQNGYNVGTQTIGSNAYGAEQRGFVEYTASATNAGVGSIQLLNLVATQAALMTGHASIGLGGCTVTNDQAIVAGDGLVSHGNGTVTARGFYGDGSGLTNLIVTGTLVTNSVTTDKLAANAVTAEKLSEGSVTGAKIAPSVINSEHLADGAVSVAKLSMDASLNMNMNRVANLGNPVNDGDAVTKSYLRAVLSAIPPQGDLSMGSFTNGAPTSFPLSF